MRPPEVFVRELSSEEGSRLKLTVSTKARALIERLRRLMVTVKLTVRRPAGITAVTKRITIRGPSRD